MTQSVEVKPSWSSELDSNHIDVRIIRFKKPKIIDNTLKVLMIKVDSVQIQMSGVSKEIKTLRENQNEKLEVKNIKRKEIIWEAH